MTINKSEKIWQFLSIDGRSKLLSNSEIDDLYTGDDIDSNKVSEVTSVDYKDLDKQYKDFLDLVAPYEYPYLSKLDGWASFFYNK